VVDDRWIFDTDSDPGMQVVATESGLSFSNQDDWLGDTEAGFGATVAVTLTRAQVALLHDSLGRWLAVQNETPLAADSAVSTQKTDDEIDAPKWPDGAWSLGVYPKLDRDC